MQLPNALRRCQTNDTKASSLLFGSWKGCAEALLCVAVATQGGCNRDDVRSAPSRSIASRAALGDSLTVDLGKGSLRYDSGTLLSRVLWARGGPNGKGLEEFGRLVDGALDSELNAYLLDRSTSSIVVIDSLGNFLRAIGRSGRGPGELSDPLALVHDGERTLYVLDNVNGVVAFDTRSMPTPTSRSVRFPFMAQDICLYGDHVIAFGSFEGRSIHEMAKDGSLLRSFGEYVGPREHPHHLPAFNDVGKVACFPTLGIVISTTQIFGHIRAIRVSDGNVLWTDSVPGFVPWTVLTTPESYSIGPSVRSGADKQYVLRPLDSTHVVVQSKRWDMAADSKTSGDSLEVIKTCVLDVRKAGCIVAGLKNPAFVASRRGTSLALREDEYWYASLAVVRIARSPCIGASGKDC